MLHLPRLPTEPMSRFAPLAALLLLAMPALAQSAPPAPGKYGCAETMPRYINGSFEYQIEGRGFVTLQPGGRYVDPFRVSGRYQTKGDTTRFTGGALDGGFATPMKGNRLWVVIPTPKKSRRWSCSLKS